MDKGKVIIISPDGNLYFSSIGEKGHAVKLISYYDDNNIDYDKETAMFTPSQEFAFNLSDMGYIVFLVEDKLNSIINYINKNINVRSDKKWHQKL